MSVKIISIIEVLYFTESKTLILKCNITLYTYMEKLS